MSVRDVGPSPGGTPEGSKTVLVSWTCPGLPGLLFGLFSMRMSEERIQMKLSITR